MLAVLVPAPISTLSWSLTLAPILYPWMMLGGVSSAALNPYRYRWLVIPTEVVSPTSNDTQSISVSSEVTALGAIIDVTYAVLSLTNAVFLNPVAANEFCPKFEFEFVIEASPPDSPLKCAVYPIANTETIWMNASFVILMCVESQPFL